MTFSKLAMFMLSQFRGCVTFSGTPSTTRATTYPSPTNNTLPIVEPRIILVLPEEVQQ